MLPTLSITDLARTETCISVVQMMNQILDDNPKSSRIFHQIGITQPMISAVNDLLLVREKVNSADLDFVFVILVDFLSHLISLSREVAKQFIENADRLPFDLLSKCPEHSDLVCASLIQVCNIFITLTCLRISLFTFLSCPDSWNTCNH